MSAHPREPHVKTLFALSGNECAMDDCHDKLTDATWRSVRGRVCHIRAQSPGGPRYDATYPDVHAYENLILLCLKCHNVVDDLLPDKWTVELLTAMKIRHESRALRDWADDVDLVRFARIAIHLSDVYEVARKMAMVATRETVPPALPGDLRYVGSDLSPDGPEAAKALNIFEFRQGVGAQLAAIRQHHGWTVTDVARGVELPESTVANIEAGQTSQTSLTTYLERLESFIRSGNLAADSADVVARYLEQVTAHDPNA